MGAANHESRSALAGGGVYLFQATFPQRSNTIIKLQTLDLGAAGWQQRAAGADIII